MTLQTQHLEMLLLYQRWAPPSNQCNMPAPNPFVLGELFEFGLIERDAKWQVVLTDAGNRAIHAAAEGMRAAARLVAA